jgi:molybdopterin molybdotransferase
METGSSEIDDGSAYIGYREAFELVCSSTQPGGTEEISLELSVGRIAAEDTIAQASYPSADVSLKDGYAVKSADLAKASERRPVFLKKIGSAFAGSGFDGRIRSGSAVRVCSGAPIPEGAEAVVAGEFCEEISQTEVSIRADAEMGRNILRTGEEVKAGLIVSGKGAVFSPGIVGLAAAAGIRKVAVFRRPKAALMGIGDEIVAPGQSLQPGQIYASNLTTMAAWLSSYGIECITSVVSDNAEAIIRELEKRQPEVDAILTSGGAWGSERDLVVGTLRRINWKEAFHHVRMGPGKGTAFGLWEDKPVFCLPGGPASNEMAFLQLALPGILRMSGDRRPPLPSVPARLSEELKSRHRNWTEFRDAMLASDSGRFYTVSPYSGRSRLQAIARVNSLVCIPEGTECLCAGEIVPVQIMNSLPNIA